MLTPLERVNNLLADLRFAQVDFDALYAEKTLDSGSSYRLEHHQSITS